MSLSDRFGLWLGFHKCSQDEYLEMVDGYVAYHGLAIADERCAPKRWNGRRRAAAARAASPCSSRRTWPAGSGVALAE